MTKEEQIKTVASRIARILEENKDLTYNNFTSGLDTLLKLILEDKKDE